MGKKFDYQYIIIGSGTAGTSAALCAAKLGIKTAIIESTAWGGSSVNYQEIPYGAAQSFAQTYQAALDGVRFGISSQKLKYNYPSALNWQARAIRRASTIKKDLEAAGVTCYRGFAHFISPHEISVGKNQISGERFLIATGNDINASSITGVATTPSGKIASNASGTTGSVANKGNVKCWSPKTALRMAKLPKTLLIVGAGATGCELAEYFASLGVQVLLAEAQSQILPHEDPDASDAISKYLQELGVQILTSSRVTAVEQDYQSKQAIFIRGNQEKSVRVNAIVFATSPEPNTDCGLENAGVKYNFSGIEVDQNLQTSNRHIWAAGDCIGGDSSSERAAYEGRLATINALRKAGNIVNYTGFTRQVHTALGLAQIGLLQNDYTKFKFKIKVATIPLKDLPAAIINDSHQGFLKLITSDKGQILGATIVAPHADLIAQELALSIRTGLNVNELADTPHIATSWGEVVNRAARKIIEKQ